MATKLRDLVQQIRGYIPEVFPWVAPSSLRMTTQGGTQTRDNRITLAQTLDPDFQLTLTFQLPLLFRVLNNPEGVVALTGTLMTHAGTEVLRDSGLRPMEWSDVQGWLFLAKTWYDNFRRAVPLEAYSTTVPLSLIDSRGQILTITGLVQCHPGDQWIQSLQTDTNEILQQTFPGLHGNIAAGQIILMSTPPEKLRVALALHSPTLTPTPVGMPPQDVLTSIPAVAEGLPVGTYMITTTHILKTVRAQDLEMAAQSFVTITHSAHPDYQDLRTIGHNSALGRVGVSDLRTAHNNGWLRPAEVISGTYTVAVGPVDLGPTSFPQGALVGVLAPDIVFNFGTGAATRVPEEDLRRALQGGLLSPAKPGASVVVHSLEGEQVLWEALDQSQEGSDGIRYRARVPLEVRHTNVPGTPVYHLQEGDVLALKSLKSAVHLLFTRVGVASEEPSQHANVLQAIREGWLRSVRKGDSAK